MGDFLLITTNIPMCELTFLGGSLLATANTLSRVPASIPEERLVAVILALAATCSDSNYGFINANSRRTPS